MSQTPIQKKIEELVYKYSNVHYERGDIDEIAFGLALAQYIKEEVVPEERKPSNLNNIDNGYSICRSKVVDKFKEMGL